MGVVYSIGLDWAGLLGPDEPRYASIGRSMAESGDWITPRLWGEVWLEKPALLYWLVGAGHKSGLTGETAARFPVVAVSLAFLAFQWFALRKLAGEATAWLASLMLASSAGWIAFSQVAATDLPLAATFNAAVLAMLLGRDRDWRPGYAVAGVCFGLALLAKGLVAAALAAPLLWFFRREWKSLVGVAAIAGAVASIWYVPMFWLHGAAFWQEFFLKHHFGRFASEALQHVQPFWFYVPVLAGWIYPWPLLGAAALLARRNRLAGCCSELWWTAIWGFVFFSASKNKLPGYVLPLVPMLIAVAAHALAGESEAPQRKGRWMLWTGFMLFLMPVAATVLPQALMHGLSRVSWSSVPWEYFAFSLAAGACAQWLDSRGQRRWAMGLLSALVLCGAVYVKLSAFPVLDRVVSARAIARRVEMLRSPVCVESLHRSLRYGLNYYVRPPVADCVDTPTSIRIVQPKGGLPAVEGRQE